MQATATIPGPSNSLNHVENLCQANLHFDHSTQAQFDHSTQTQSCPSDSSSLRASSSPEVLPEHIEAIMHWWLTTLCTSQTNQRKKNNRGLDVVF